MNNLTDTIAQILSSEAIRDAVLILCGVLLVVVVLRVYGRLIRRGRPTYPTYSPAVRFYQPPPPAEDTRPSRAVHLPAAITVVSSSRSAIVDTKIRFSGEADWPTLSDTEPFKPIPAGKIDSDAHPTRPRRTR